MQKCKYHLFRKNTEKPIIVNGVSIGDEISCEVNRPYGTSDWFMAYFYNPVKLRFNGKVEISKSPGLVVWAPGEAQFFEYVGKIKKYSWLYFNGSKIVKILKSCRIPVGEFRGLVRGELIEKYFFELYHELCECSYEDGSVISGIFDLMFRDISREIYCHAELDIPPKIRTARNILSKTPPTQISLDDLAESLNISKSHFSAEFRNYYGFSPIAFWNNNRMEYAKLLLGDYNLQISEIAEQLAFRDLYQFSRAFKKHFGLSPSSYRKR